MSTNNLNSTVLEKMGTIEDALDVNGDPVPEPRLPPHVAALLGQQLRTFYAHLVSEPVPDRFVQLLEQLDGKENGRDGD